MFTAVTDFKCLWFTGSSIKKILKFCVLVQYKHSLTLIVTYRHTKLRRVCDQTEQAPNFAIMTSFASFDVFSFDVFLFDVFLFCFFLSTFSFLAIFRFDVFLFDIFLFDIFLSWFFSTFSPFDVFPFGVFHQPRFCDCEDVRWIWRVMPINVRSKFSYSLCHSYTYISKQ